MKQCPKCGSSVPDDSKECHICFAALQEAEAAPSGPLGLQTPPPPPAPVENVPLATGIPGLYPPQGAQAPPPEPPPPNYLSPGAPAAPPGSGPVRVSLTGEVIETPAAGPGGYSPPGAPQPSGPLPPPSGPLPPGARPHGHSPSGGSYTLPPRRETAPAKSGGAGVVIAIVVVLLLAAGGAFGFWWWQKQRAPAVALEKFMTAFKNKDWKTVYNLVELPPEQKSQVTEQMFTMGMGIVGNLITIKEYKVGTPTITGDTAKVPLTVTAEIAAGLGANSGTKTQNEEVPMRLVNGVWKLDGTAAKSIPGMGGGTGMGQ